MLSAEPDKHILSDKAVPVGDSNTDRVKKTTPTMLIFPDSPMTAYLCLYASLQWAKHRLACSDLACPTDLSGYSGPYEHHPSMRQASELILTWLMDKGWKEGQGDLNRFLQWLVADLSGLGRFARDILYNVFQDTKCLVNNHFGCKSRRGFSYVLSETEYS